MRRINDATKPSLANPPSLVNDQNWPTVAATLGLTRRQADVVRLVLQAKKDKEIAAELRLGVSTVRMHLRYIFAHVGVTDRMELVLRVFDIAWQHSNDEQRLNSSTEQKMFRS